ncbi:hypothetical protein [Trujillonella humicola]|uniref:hypothetical protein n=1 Tax=Trujillonella humicola TaxID=3383699 RepID=UPI00390680FE
MNPTVALGVALVLMLAALPLLVVGANADIVALSVAGIAAVVVGGAIPPALRWLGPEED